MIFLLLLLRSACTFANIQKKYLFNKWLKFASKIHWIRWRIWIQHKSKILHDYVRVIVCFQKPICIIFMMLVNVFECFFCLCPQIISAFFDRQCYRFQFRIYLKQKSNFIIFIQIKKNKHQTVPSIELMKINLLHRAPQVRFTWRAFF